MVSCLSSLSLPQGVRGKVRGMSNTGSEVSADAKYIVRMIVANMWAIVLLPALIWLLLYLYGFNK